VTAGIGGMAELVRDGVDGLHFRCNDSTDLARVLQRLIDDPDLLPRLRSGVRQPRSVDQEMSQLLHIYDQVIAQRNEPIREAI
jgi:glycosyltransferase involved in cell wall biosynthesis